MSTKTSTLIKSAYTLAYQIGLNDAAQGRDCRPPSVKEARKAIKTTCTCEASRQAPKHIARSFALGYQAGFVDLLGAEVASRNLHNDPTVVSIEAARSAQLARIVECDSPLVVGD